MAYNLQELFKKRTPMEQINEVWKKTPIMSTPSAKTSVGNSVTKFGSDLMTALSFMPVGAGIGGGIGATRRGAVGILGKSKNIYQSLKGYLAKEFVNPLEGVTIKEGLKSWSKNIFGKTLKTTMGIEAGKLAYSGVTGNPYNPLMKEGIAKTILSSSISPTGAIVGSALGIGTKSLNFGKKVVKAMEDISKPEYMSIPGITPSINVPNLSVPAEAFAPNVEIPSLGGSFGYSITTPSVGGFSPSVNVGGGGFPTELLLLLLGGGLGAGYLLGRKKRKKYKHKKRKK